jgi:hypothetical protein
MNMRLALDTDGINPFSEKRSSYSVSPILLLNYSVAPWLTFKKYFVMLSSIIPGKHAVTGEHFDLYLEPLIEELQILWRDGILVRDAARQSYQRIKAILMFTIHDYPAYGLVAGLVTKGYRGCVCCGPNTISRWSDHLKKNVFDDQHRIYLPESHWMREEEALFRGRSERRTPSPRMTGPAVRLAGEARQRYVVGGGTISAREDPVRVNGVKKASVLFTLPYWEVSFYYHHFSNKLVDFMK